MSSKSWEDIVQEKRNERAKRIEHHLKGAITDEEREKSESILNIDHIHDLSIPLASGKLSANDVLSSYIRRAVEAHQQTNCLTEVFFEDALKDAARLDEHFQRHGTLIGPLHGVPVTLKDQFDVKGFDSTIGYVARAFHPAQEDSVLVKILRDLGAIILAKTNLPQSIMWCETDNPLWGLTVNPLNAAYTPGGSTGGEGALLALHGSLLGWGTDIGGSIRIPSHMNGLWGLKPTSSRLPYQGLQVSTDGQGHVPSSVGPMARSLSTLVTTMQAIIGRKPWLLDPNVTPMPWQLEVFENVQSRPITVGLLTDDGVVKVHPPIERALREVAAKLEAAGHEIVLWNNAGHADLIAIQDLFYSSDGGEDVRREVQAGGEPFIPHVNALINREQAISVYEYWQLNKRKVAAQQAYNKKWNDTIGPSGRPVDVLLMPTMPHVAVPHRSCRWVGYTKVWNVLDYAAVTFPAGKVNARLDQRPKEAYEPRNDLDAWNRALYDCETMDNHPIGLQLVGRRFEEEKVLGVAAVIEKLTQA
ncbi:acetamidase [Tothia fuscella]|uniref:Acetamidase n=1 Tax=Tothia fuscella TaxID=1048955 RepID=A0A9P4NEC9_9PEZI|nr:acetamidase [Tothia fuscella]